MLIPEGIEETQRDRPCPECLRLPPAPKERGEPEDNGASASA